jgi:hypothetical protein
VRCQLAELLAASVLSSYSSVLGSYPEVRILAAMYYLRMETRVTPEGAAARRTWVVLMYFYVAALVGLGFVIVGTTSALFGAKSALFPELGLSTYSYSCPGPEQRGTTVASETERQAARETAIQDRRGNGVDGLANGAIQAGVGLPILIWHLRRARRLGAAPG